MYHFKTLEKKIGNYKVNKFSALSFYDVFAIIFVLWLSAAIESFKYSGFTSSILGSKGKYSVSKFRKSETM
jgi:hypothetical protein